MKLRGLFRLMLVVSSAYILLACTTPFKVPVFESRPPKMTQFPGITQLVAAGPNRELDVLMVHGMCTHNQVWAVDAITRLNATVKGSGKPEIVPYPIQGTETTLYQSTLNVDGGTVRISALVWSPVTTPLKNQLCYDQTNKSSSCKQAGHEKPSYPYKRASLNRALKDDLLNDCLADAIIYQGKSRDAINEQVQKAILAALAAPNARMAGENLAKAAAEATTPLVFITESLGSKVTFDAIYKLVKSRDANIRAAGLRTIERTTQVFMGANQLPILALADQTLDGTTMARADCNDYPVDPLAALLDLKKSRGPGVAMVTPRVVAFTDPNDLLSFILVPAKQVATYDVVDVIVSNKTTYFGFLERPDSAHTGYRENPLVLQLIACGNQKGGCDPP